MSVHKVNVTLDCTHIKVLFDERLGTKNRYGATRLTYGESMTAVVPQPVQSVDLSDEDAQVYWM